MVIRKNKSIHRLCCVLQARIIVINGLKQMQMCVSGVCFHISEILNVCIHDLT